MPLLDGRHAIVTGAANGIGRAIAERFRAEGARVSGIDVEAGTEVCFDLSDVDAIPALVDRIEAGAGPVDIVCSVAGVFEPSPALELTQPSYRRVLAVNLDAPVALAVRCGRGMADRGYGRILSITSIHGQRGEELSLVVRHLQGRRSRARRARSPSSWARWESSSTRSPRASSTPACRSSTA